MAKVFNRDKFKQLLFESGYQLDDQQINNLINQQLSLKGQSGQMFDNVPFSRELFEQVQANETHGTDETGRANRHNNPGAHIWSQKRAELYGAKKGDPFTGEDGNTYYTAKYDTLAQGSEASRRVVETHIRKVVESGVDVSDPEFYDKFTQSYTGLNPDNPEQSNRFQGYSQRLQSGMSNRTSALQQTSLAPSAFDTFDYSEFKTPEERNAALDFVGNALWSFLDTGSMGIAGYLDADDSLQKFLQGEEGPSTFAGRAGSGVGGLAGYMVPMGAARGVAGAGIRSFSKYGTKKFTNKVATEGTEYLSKTVSKGKGYKKFNSLTKDEQNNMFKNITDQVLQNTTKFKQFKVDEAFAKKLASSSDDAIAAALKTHSLPNTQKNVAAIRRIIEKSLLQNGNRSVVPISSLQQRIAMMAGKAPGSGKVANIATHALEEAFLFAAVETPMELFQSMNEERDADYLGRGAHSMALGTALGIIKSIPGGKLIRGYDGQQSSLSKEVFRKAMRTVSRNKPYRDVDIESVKGGEHLKLMARGQFKGLKEEGMTIFNEGLEKTEYLRKNPDFKVLTAKNIDELAETPDGRQALKEILDYTSREWDKRWGPAFLKDAMEDIGGSMPRMILGSMAFNYEIMFDDNVPLEDKMFNVLLGAFMTKNHYQSSYVDKDGKMHKMVAGPENFATRLNEVNEYLGYLNMKPKDFVFHQLLNDANLKTNFFKNAADSPDVQKINEFLVENGLLVDADVRISKKNKKTRAQRGDNGLYDALKIMIDGDVIVTDNKRLLDPNELSKAKFNKIIKGLNELSFDDVDVKSIKTPSDLIDIIDHAHDGVWNKFESAHLESAASIFNYLSGSGNRSPIDITPGKTPTFFSIKVNDPKNLEPQQKRVLDTYNKLVDMLDGRSIVLDKNDSYAMSINAKDVDETLISRLDKDNQRIDELVNGVAGVDMTQSARLAQEGWTYELYTRYAKKRDVRRSYEKLKNLDNPKQFEELSDGSKHNGQLIQEFNDKIFLDPRQSYVIYDKIKFEGNISDDMKQFISAYHGYLKHNPDVNIPILEGQSKTLTIKAGSQKYTDLLDLRKILNKEGITVFSKKGQELNQYLENFLDYSRHKDLAGVIKSNGKPLNDIDRSILNDLLDFGLVGRNFEMPEIVGFADELIRVTDNLSKKNLDNLMNEDSVVGNFLKDFSKDIDKEPQDILNSLKQDYEDFIKPYIKDGKGAGILKVNTLTPAVVNPAEFTMMFSLLKEIKTINRETSHKDLLNQIEKISKNSAFSKSEQDLLNNVYTTLSKPNANLRGVVSYMIKNDMYDVVDNTLKIDEDNVSRIDKLKDMLNETQLIMDEADNDNEITNILNSYKDQFTKDSDVDIYYNESRETIRKKYNFGQDYDFSSKTVDDFIKDGYIEVNKEKLYIDDMKEADRTKFINDITKMLFSNETQRSIPRLTARKAGIDIDDNNKMYDNSLFRTMDFLLNDGVVDFKYRDLDTGFAIIDTKFVDGNKIVETRGDSDEAVKARKSRTTRFSGKEDKYLIDKKFDTDEDGNLRYSRTPGYVIIGIGDLTFDIGIRRDKLNTVGKKIDELLQENEKTYSGAQYKESHKTLRKLFTDIFEKTEIKDDKDNVIGFDYEFKPTSKQLENETLEVLVTHAMMNGVTVNGKKTGLGKVWWDHLANTHGKAEGIEVLKKARRMTLLSNVSMKELSSTHLDNVINLVNTYGGKKEADVLSALKSLKKNNGFKLLIAEDEDFSRVGTSINKDLKAQIEAAGKKSKDKVILRQTKDQVDGTTNYANGGDVSSVDSYTAVSPKVMKALYKLAGAGNVEGLGGIKPIIHRLGDNIIIGKTAFISDPKIDKFLKQNGADMVMFGSAAKIHYDKSKFITGWNSLDELANIKLGKDDTDKIELIGLDELSLGSVVNSDKDASSPYQSFKDLSLEDSDEVFEWMLSGKLKDYNDAFGKYMDPKNNDGIAFAKYLMQSRTLDNQNSLSERLFLNNLNPLSSLVRDDFINMIKGQHLDKAGIFTPKTEHGVQSVTSPATKQLFTLFDTEGKVYQFGQVEVPANAGRRSVNLDNLHLIKRNENGYDEVVLAKDLIGKKLDVKTGQKGLILDIKSNDTLEQIVNKLKSTNYEVATVVRRNPSTRPGDMVVLGIKDVLAKEYGNTTKVNASDFAYRLEGDHDIDKVDTFWDTPTNTLNKWIDLSGKVDRVIPDGPDKKTTVTNKSGGGQFDWLVPGDMAKYRNDLEYSMKMRGVTVKAQRVLQGITEYSSELKQQLVDADGNKIKGLVLDTGQGKGGIIHVDLDLLEEAKKVLAKDIQDITDAATGYDKKRFKDWEKNFYFGDGNPLSRYKGIFKKAEWDDKLKKYVTSDATFEANELQKDMILDYLRPYKSLLQLGTNVYSEGVAKSVQYNDIIEGVKKFDNDMFASPVRMYYSMMKKHRNKASEIQEIFLTKSGQMALQKGESLSASKGHFYDPYRGFHNNIRPNLKQGGKIDNLLPFERSMAFIALNDKSKIDIENKLYGEAEKEFDSFFDDINYDEDLASVSSKFITKLEKDNRMMGYAGYLGSKISKLISLEKNAERRNNTGSAEYYRSEIDKLVSKKEAIEEKITTFSLDAENKANVKNAIYNLTEQAKKSEIRGIIKNGHMPKGFASEANKVDGYKKPKTFSKNDIYRWAKQPATQKALFNYIKSKGIIRFKGMRNTDYIDVYAAEQSMNMIRNLIIDDVGGKAQEGINDEIMKFKKFYGKAWAGVLSGKDAVYDNVKLNSEIMARLDDIYLKLETQGTGQGKKFIYDLMIPRREQTVFTYITAGTKSKLLPAFQDESLKFYNLGLKWMNKTKLMDESIEKSLIFETVAKSHNIVWDKFYGQKRNNALDESVLKDDIAEAMNIMSASPLLDDISSYNLVGGFQEQLVNPDVRVALGLTENQSINSLLGNKSILPQDIKTLVESSIMPFGPKAYIDQTLNGGTRHPAIHGIKDYNNAIETGVIGFLGDTRKQNLVYDESSNNYKEEPPALKGEGKRASKQNFESKIDCVGNV